MKGWCSSNYRELKELYRNMFLCSDD
uniref:Uncharacterized protein n=1 Tax=Rhizophora mucronata TaxID=61149 RepID=A0A2P2J744_RHIMU